MFPSPSRSVSGAASAVDPARGRRTIRRDPLGRIAVGDVTAGQRGERAEARRATQETTAAGVWHQLGRIFDQQLRIHTGNYSSLAHEILLSPRDHCPQALRHNERERHMHDKKSDDCHHRKKMNVTRRVVAAE